MRGLVCVVMACFLLVSCDWGDKPPSSASDVVDDTGPAVPSNDAASPQPDDAGPTVPPADAAPPPPDVSPMADAACAPGWEGPQCDQNINECVDPSLNTCDDNAGCVDTPGSFLCVCKWGYSGDGFSCANIDECADNGLNDCDFNAECTDTPGSYDCTCLKGYFGNGQSCTNIDECGIEALNNCDANASCTDVGGGYYCECNPGFTGDGVVCTNVDECADDTLNNCHIYATCTDTDGAFDCECNAGFAGDGLVCLDVDECADPALNDCDSSNGYCVDTQGSYDCVCNAGYEMDGALCVNIDECGNSVLNDCDSNAICTDTGGSYFCECKPGFKATSWGSCFDIKECKDPALNDCDVNAVCVDVPGGYECTCNVGYAGTGLACADVNMCASPTLNPCAKNAVCTDLVGGFECACKPGFLGDGIICVANTTCSTAIAVPELPYWDEGSTQGQQDDYQVLVPGDSSGYQVGEGTEDVAYAFMPVVSGPHTIRVRSFIELNSNSVPAPTMWVWSAFYVITDCADPNGSLVALVQEAMGSLSEPTYYKKLTLVAGVPYFLIIDGDPQFGPSPFDYRVEIGAGCVPLPPGLCGTNACGKKYSCPGKDVCVDTLCCTPSCDPKACGTDNGCGGTCKCSAGDYCYEGGVCGPSCDLMSCLPATGWWNECKESVCDPVLGCVYQNRPDGISCPDDDDGECIVGKTCQQGQCVGGQVLDCGGGWSWCSPMIDVCEYDVKPTWGTTQDGDNDGYSEFSNDCMDNDPSVHPGATEFCDGKNNDCVKGNDFDWVDCYTGPMGSLGVGECQPGYRQCSGGNLGPCQQEVTPVAEICDDGLDNDCDGAVDEGCP